MNQVIRKEIIKRYPPDKNPFIKYLIEELEFAESEIKRLENLYLDSIQDNQGE